LEKSSLLNNVVELSDGIVTNIDDLTTLIAIITNQSKEKVQIVIKEIELKNCCLSIVSNCLSETLPLYRQIEVILVNNEPFKNNYPDSYKTMEEKYNIILNYVLIKNNIKGIALSIQDTKNILDY
jgi:predicted HAD superfamily phosphohydrolase YqeG